MATIVIRIAQAVVVIFALSVIVFTLLHVAPGDPTDLLIPEHAPPEFREEMREKFGLNDPLQVQYGRFLGNALQGDLGMSFQYQVPAMELVIARVPATAELALAGMAIATALGLLIGILSAVYRNTAVDHIGSIITYFAVSMPNYWIGLLLILLFSVNLGILPVSGRGGLEHLVLPAFALGIGLMPPVARIVRSSMIEVMVEDFVWTARAKGVNEWRITIFHVLRNALIPAVTIIGMYTGVLLGGAAIIETVFGWPGAGRLILQAAEFQDYPLVLAGVFVLSIAVVLANLIVDLLYIVIDPRLRVG